MTDAIVIGAGPNGLVAAAELARHGWSVLVLEAKDRPGGAVYSEELTLPGYLHDVGAAFFPFAEDSPAFRSLDLVGAGLQWRNATWESCHPAPDGSCATLGRSPNLGLRLGAAASSSASMRSDESAWRELAQWQRRMGSRLAEAVLAPLPAFAAAWRLGLMNVLRLGLHGVASTAGWSQRMFKTEAARRIIPSLALHVDLGPDDLAGAGLGLVLALLASSTGFRVPVGGAKAITDALAGRLQEAGGKLRLGTRVERIIVRGGRAVAVRTNQGDEIEFHKAVLADVGAPTLYLRLLAEEDISAWMRQRMKRFRYGWGTFKMDWALRDAVPWLASEARESAVVHAGDSIVDLRRFTKEVRAGRLPCNPYLVIGQQSLVDSSRAPAGCHTLYAYTHVPSNIAGGWQANREAFADRIEERIEALAPGFRELILARALHSPLDLEAMNENLVGGDLGGGSAQWDQQLFLRPIFPYFRHRTPIKRLYLASASAHPGAGVHGACGWNAAHQAYRDWA